MENYWKISDFAKKLNKHNNTVDGWFRSIEERKLHHISRINNEKVYDELDLKIAQFIIEKREAKWSLDAIFDSLPDNFSLRPFPPDYEDQPKSLEVVDVDKIRAAIKNEMRAVFEEIAATQIEKQKKEFQLLLPSKEEQRFERFNMVMAERKVIRRLEEEALSKWAEKPPGERLVKVSWFRKEEDKDKRDRFVKAYVDEHFEEAMKEEFGIYDDDM